MKHVLVTTKHRGVFYGMVDENSDLSQSTLKLLDAKMAIYWGTTKGVAQLAHTGPTDKSKIGAPATVLIHDVTAVWDVTDEAAEKWKNA